MKHIKPKPGQHTVLLSIEELNYIYSSISNNLEANGTELSCREVSVIHNLRTQLGKEFGIA